jgi:hypothetical protein
MANKFLFDFSGGVNLQASPLTLRDNEADWILNYDLDKIGQLKRRKGYARFLNQPVADVNINGLFGFWDASSEVDRPLMVANNSGATNGVIYTTGAGANAISATTGASGSIQYVFALIKPATAGTSPTYPGSTATGTSASASSLNVSMTVTAGNNRMLLVSVSSNVGDPSGVTFDGVAMTRAGGGSVTSYFLSLWVLPAPNVTTANVAVTFPGTQQGIIVNAIQINGVDQTAGTGGLRTTGSGNGTSTTSSSTTVPTAQATDAIVVSYANNANTTQTVGSGLTQVQSATATSATLSDTLRQTLSYKLFGQWIPVKTNETASKKTRFAVFIDYVFRVNGADVVATSADAQTWGTTNAPGTILPAYVAVFQDRVYVARGSATGQKSRVWFSSLPSAGAITWTTGTDFFDVNPDDGDEITALENNGNRLLIFKHDAMYRWTFGAVEPDRVIGVGTDSQESVKTNFDIGVTFFANRRGVYAYSGSRPQLISRKIQPIIDAVSDWSETYAWVDRDHYYLSVGSITFTDIFGQLGSTLGSRTLTNCVLVYNVPLDSWVLYATADRIRFSAYLYARNDTVYFGSTTGRTYNFSTVRVSDDDGGTSTPIAAELTTREVMLTFPRKATLKGIDTFGEASDNSRVFYELDRKEPPVPLGATNQRVNYFRIPDRELNSVRLFLTDNTAVDSQFEGFHIEYEEGTVRYTGAARIQRSIP